MTNDEMRKKCVEAMATATARMRGYNLQFMAAWFHEALILEATASLDAIHPIASVLSREPSQEMIEAGWQTQFDTTQSVIATAYSAMVIAGDITKPLEKRQ